MHRGHFAQIQQFGQPLRVLAVVFVLRAVDQPELTRMRDEHSCSESTENVVVMAITATGLIADLEPIMQPFEDSHHLVDRPHLAAVNDLSRLVEYTNRDAFGVNVESDVEHRNLLESANVKSPNHNSRYQPDRGFLHRFTSKRASACEESASVKSPEGNSLPI